MTVLLRPRPRLGKRLIAALDTAEAAQAATWATALAPHCGLMKVGLEFFLATGADGYAAVAARAPVFLDLKLHDIPNTVAGAVRSLLPLKPAMLTLHAQGGSAMIEAARNAAEKAGQDRPMLLAVTVLTSLDESDLQAMGVADAPREQVVRLAKLAMAAGADGLVCSPREVAPIRDALGEEPFLVVPGIRPAGAALGDQARVATPAQAVADGADWLVVGRPLTQAPDAAAAAQAIVAELPR